MPLPVTGSFLHSKVLVFSCYICLCLCFLILHLSTCLSYSCDEILVDRVYSSLGFWSTLPISVFQLVYWAIYIWMTIAILGLKSIICIGLFTLEWLLQYQVLSLSFNFILLCLIYIATSSFALNSFSVFHLSIFILFFCNCILIYLSALALP